MEKENLIKRITVNPNICFGKPTIRGLRYPVVLILDLLSSEMTWEEILEDYPDLERNDLKACIVFATEMLRVKSIQKILAA